MVCNRILLSHRAPPGKRGVNVLCLIGPYPGTGKPGPDDVFYHLFRREPVFLIHGQQKGREHDHQHGEHGPGVADKTAGEQVGRDAHRRRTAKADKLAFGKVKGHFGFDFG